MKVNAFRCLAPRLHGMCSVWNADVERALSRATGAKAQPEEPALLSAFTRQIAPRYDGFSRFKHLGLLRHALGRSDLLRASAGPLAAGRSPDSFAGPTPRLPLAGRWHASSRQTRAVERPAPLAVSGLAGAASLSGPMSSRYLPAAGVVVGSLRPVDSATLPGGF